MKVATTLALCAAALTASLAQAGGVRAVDVPRISNGGTGFIGVTESANAPRAQIVPAAMSNNVSRIPSQAGEASTMVNGRPNGNPDAPTVAGSTTASSAVMGAGSSSWAARPSHPLWGTPD